MTQLGGHVTSGSLRFERVEEIFNFTLCDYDILECASVGSASRVFVTEGDLNSALQAF